MADVTINQLPIKASPLGTDLVPIADTGNTITNKATISSLPVDWPAVTNKPSIGTNAAGNRTVSTGTPAGGSNGDIWYQV